MQNLCYIETRVKLRVTAGFVCLVANVTFPMLGVGNHWCLLWAELRTFQVFNCSWYTPSHPWCRVNHVHSRREVACFAGSKLTRRLRTASHRARVPPSLPPPN